MKEIIQRAIDRLLAEDTHLFEVDANERSITHRLAIYLQELLPDWNVDCEYNRNFDDPKRLDVLTRDGTTMANDTDATTVFPDIIVHHRNTNENHLVIEVKKTTSNRTDQLDLEKLRGFRQQLRYEHALFLKLKAGGDGIGIHTMHWIT
jgi:hypothetical protein